MDNNTTLNQPKSAFDSPSRRVTTYNVLMQQSRKLGKIATHAVTLTKQFLRTETSALHPDTLLFGFSPNQPSEASRLSSFTERTHEVLASVKTFPLPQNIFPDTIILDRAKLTITTRSFFWDHKTISVHIEDILNVECSTGPFFGSITVSIRIMNSTDHYTIDCLWKRDAIYLKNIIEGCMIAHRNNLETSNMDSTTLRDALLELGKDSCI
ncbi:hypothetical protein KC952_04210 [Candidatus Saccharibacteria bacterium]|nr:hypothetical protein [Candidatus Saccharibacteria bacterium]